MNLIVLWIHSFEQKMVVALCTICVSFFVHKNMLWILTTFIESYTKYSQKDWSVPQNQSLTFIHIRDRVKKSTKIVSEILPAKICMLPISVHKNMLWILTTFNKSQTKYILLKRSTFITKSRTTDARLGNCLHCTAENQLPLPNF